MKESGLILLQTIPATINIHSLKAELLTHFPDIVNVHDFHVWQLTASKVISTVHIIFQNPKVTIAYRLQIIVNSFSIIFLTFSSLVIVDLFGIHTQLYY